MAEERPSDLLGSLPRTRPHRRSAKRPTKAGARKASTDAATAQRSPTVVAMASKPPAKRARPAGTKASPGGTGASQKRAPTDKARSGRLRQPPQPRGIPSAPRSPVPPAPQRPEVIGTAVQAIAE